MFQTRSKPLLYATSETHRNPRLLNVKIILDIRCSGMKVDISPCTVCGMKVRNKSALVQHVTTEKRKWGDRLPEGAAGHLSVGTLWRESWGIRRPNIPLLLLHPNNVQKANIWIRFDCKWCPDCPEILNYIPQMETQLPPIQPTFMQSLIWKLDVSITLDSKVGK